MRKNLSTLFTCILVLLPIMVMGQQRDVIITGKVTDVEGEPLPGTNIILRDYNLGAATDINGNYKFKVPGKFAQGQQIEITARYIGYHSKTETVTLSPGEATVDFSMALDVLEMDAIVVTGVAEETPKTMLPFTVARVSKEQVEMVPAVSAVGAIRGKISGVSIVKGSGKPGDPIAVRMRGTTHIDGTSTPLYIVDGVILAASQVDVDALDIESIEVVKGAAASSLYGSRAADGVVQIKTARGNRLALGETRIRIRNEFGWNQFVKKDYRSEHHEFTINENGEYLNNEGQVVTFANAVLDKVTPDAPYEGSGWTFQDNTFPGTIYDHMDLFLDPGYFYTNTISISQNKPGTNYYLSFSNLQESGIVDALNGFGRQNVRLNVDQRMGSGLVLGASVYYANSNRDDPSRRVYPHESVNPFYNIGFINPNADLLAPNEDGVPYIIQPDSNTLQENPLYTIHNQEFKDYRKRFMSSLSAKWTPFAWFNMESNFSYDRSDRLSTDYYPNGYKTVDMQTNPTGKYLKDVQFDQAINASITASLYKNFGDFSSKTKLKYLYESDEYNWTEAYGTNLAVNGVHDLSAAQDGIKINSTEQDIKAIGYFFTTGIDYKEKYIADAMFRYDGSSLFGENERWHPYYRGSLAWRISREPWWFTDKINEMKFRLSYGTAGIRPDFSAQYETFALSDGNLAKNNLGNKELKPSLAQELEVGLEMAFFDRFALDLTFANTVVEDQILNVPLAAYYGFGNRWMNAGTVKSKAFEVELKAFILQKKDMSWSAGLVFDTYTQKVTEFDLPPYSYGINQIYAFMNRKNEVLGAMYGSKWITGPNELPADYDPSQFEKNDDDYLVPVGSGNSWKDGVSKNLWGTQVDADGDGEGDLEWGLPFAYEDADGNEVVKIGDVVPDFNLGFNTSFSWKGLTLYGLLDAQIGGDIYNNTRQWAYRELRHLDCDQSGKPEQEKKPIDYYNRLYYVNAINSEFVESGTYLKLRELSLRYSIDRGQLRNLFGKQVGNVFHRITFGIIGRNLLTFTNYSGFDPEVGINTVRDFTTNNQSDATLLRLDSSRYPQFRTFTGFLEVEL